MNHFKSKYVQFDIQNYFLEVYLKYIRFENPNQNQFRSYTSKYKQELLMKYRPKKKVQKSALKITPYNSFWGVFYSQ